MSLDFSNRSELDWLARLVLDAERASPGLDLLLVGARARDLLLHYGHGQAIERGTTDVDFALATEDWARFLDARAALITSGRFAPEGAAIHRLRHVDLGLIDFIPFGTVENADGTIAWPPSGDEVMDVLGLREAAASALTAALPRGQTVRLVSLPMLAVLKLLAWSDRHVATHGRDAVDLWLILRRYLDAGNDERLYSEFSHLLHDGFDYERASGWMLGHDARSVLHMHSARIDRVIDRLQAIFTKELDPSSSLKLVTQLSPHEPERAIRLLSAFYDGLVGEVEPGTTR